MCGTPWENSNDDPDPSVDGDEGGVAGDPAIGYGFDLITWTISQIESALTYAFGGTLTADQQDASTSSATSKAALSVERH